MLVYVLDPDDEAFGKVPNRGPAVVSITSKGQVVMKIEMSAKQADRLRFDLEAGGIRREAAEEPYAATHRS